MNPNRWLQWLSVVKAVRNYILKFTNYNMAENDFLIGDSPLRLATSKMIYCYIIYTVYGDETHVPRVSFYLPNIDMDTYSDVHHMLFKEITDRKTQEFQYKFLNDILINKYWLCKWKIIDTDICQNCKKSTETILHLFWECPAVSEFWAKFNVYVRNSLGVTVNVKDVFLGTRQQPLCSLIMIAKRYIYKCMFKEELPKLQPFLSSVKYTKRIEEVISKRNNSIDKWFKKWHKI